MHSATASPSTANDYRVLQPRLVTDPNRNRTEVAFDTLGMVVGTAVMGKPLPRRGRRLAGPASSATSTQAELDGLFDAPPIHAANATALLKDATTRIVYDLDRFRRTRQAHPDDPTKWQPACAATLTRETHVSDPLPPHGLKIQLSFSYSDGFGREIQKKIQAEPGAAASRRGADESTRAGSAAAGRSSTTRASPSASTSRSSPTPTASSSTSASASARCCSTTRSSAWSPPCTRTTPGRRSSSTRGGRRPGTSTTPALPRNAPDRRPAHRSGHRAASSPRTSRRSLPTWQPGTPSASAARSGTDEQAAASKAAAHADTPTTAHFDALGRAFLTVAHNKSFAPATTSTAPKTVSPPASNWTSKATSAKCATRSNRPATRSAASSCATTTTCWATASTSSAWRPASAGC